MLSKADQDQHYGKSNHRGFSFFVPIFLHLSYRCQCCSGIQFCNIIISTYREITMNEIEYYWPSSNLWSILHFSASILPADNRLLLNHSSSFLFMYTSVCIRWLRYPLLVQEVLRIYPIGNVIIPFWEIF